MSLPGPITKLQRSFAYRLSQRFPSQMLRWMDLISAAVDGGTVQPIQSPPVLISNKAAGGSIGNADVTVDVATFIEVDQTTASQTLTLPNATLSSDGHLLVVSNVGSAAFSMLGTIIPPNYSAVFIWQTGFGWAPLLGAPGIPSVDYDQVIWDGSAFFSIGIKNFVLNDSNVTYAVASGNQAVLPPATLTGNKTLTLDTAGPPVTNESVTIIRRDATAFTYAVVNGGPAAGTLYTFPISVARQATFTWNGTDWYMSSTQRLA